MMPVARKRPCCICHRWFRPDNRVGSRQRACSKPGCQALRRRKRQAAWRVRNPDYFCGRRIQARGASSQPPEPLRLPSPLHRLPWDIAQSQFGVQGADFIGIMGALLVHSAQSQLKAYRVDSAGDPATLPHLAAQSPIEPVAEWICRGEACHASGIPPT